MFSQLYGLVLFNDFYNFYSLFDNYLCSIKDEHNGAHASVLKRMTFIVWFQIMGDYFLLEIIGMETRKNLWNKGMKMSYILVEDE